MRYECKVLDITPLRIPRVYRVKAACIDVEIEIELHEDVMEAPRVGNGIIVELTSEKEKCLHHYFCGHGYVVSNTQLGDTHRVIISLYGFLVVIRSRERIGLTELEHVYLGISFTK
ncbi:MAG: DNA-directed RNA polymerase subunit G [Desulfurococcaceae archaeon]